MELKEGQNENIPGKPHFDIIVPGSYFCDIIFTGLPRFPSLGTETYCENVSVVTGGTMNTVIALRRLGVNVGWIGAVGNDFFSHFVLSQAEAEGLDTSLLRRIDGPVRRVTVAMSFAHDRAFVSYVDATPRRDELAEDALERATFKYLHFGGLVISESVPDLLDRYRAEGVHITMDCQDQAVTLENPLARAVLSRLDMFMPNRDEAFHLTGADNIPAALAALTECAPCVVIKDGANGAYARRVGPGAADLYAPAVPVQAVETTGAGDVFNAGFLAAHLAGRDLAECLRWGNFCGAMSTLGPGGTSTAPTRAQLEAWLGG